MNNPLLSPTELPAFTRIRAEHVEAALDAVIAENRREISQLIATTSVPNWESVVQRLDDLGDRLRRVWSPVRHLHSVADNDALRAAYTACLPKLAEYETELGQNRSLFIAYQAIANSREWIDLSTAQKKVIENELRDFRLSGIDLNTIDQARFRTIRQRLAQLQTAFEEHVLDATQAWKKLVTDRAQLSGLPESALALARQSAVQEKNDGWLFTLQLPSYIPVLTYADNRELRREMYSAYVTRASDQGPHAGLFDNGPTMVEILTLRQELARLLGFSCFAEYSLATKMAKSTAQVLTFLTDLAHRALPIAQTEYAEVVAFGRDHCGIDSLEVWDIAYVSEKLRQDRYAVSQEQVREYFPVDRVLDGLFRTVNLLYGLEITPIEQKEVWHADVRFFEIRDSQNVIRGMFYLDLYAREHKRGGAWMDECIVRRKTGDTIQRPVAYLTCNFSPPVDGRPSLLTHEEVITLFHEFGHGLQHMLTQIDYAGVSGINGVAWDAVELPSQFMENWCWEHDALSMFSRHYQTGLPIDDELFHRMHAAKNFQIGMQTVRQIEFALFDFRMHMRASITEEAGIQSLLDEIRSQVAVIRPPAFNRFQHSFSHVFAGGYAAGYYSYKWAEVLAADAFSKFKEAGIFDRSTGHLFMRTILEQGGARDPMDLFKEFRGREPSIEPLLTKSGMSTKHSILA